MKGAFDVSSADIVTIDPESAASAPATSPVDLTDLFTPALVLDAGRLDRNVRRMTAACDRLGVALRPHIKTPKALPVAERLRAAGVAGFTTSTLGEAELLAAAGFDDIFYAVPMAAAKVARAARLLRAGHDISFLTDSVSAIAACGAAAAEAGVVLPFWIEIDVDHYRSGVDRRDPAFLVIAQTITSHPNLALRGLMAYAGASYNVSVDGARQLAEMHRQALLDGQRDLEFAGIPCARLSLGSTPAVLHAETLAGLTEARCGIFAFQDLLQAGIGACKIDDIALSVVATVLSVNRALNRVTIDAGGMALSKDRSTQGRPFDAGYGLVCDLDGTVIPDLYVQTVSQELGLVTSLSGAPIPVERLTEGARLRILPNHADMTAAAYDRYHVVDGSRRIEAVWLRANGW